VKADIGNIVVPPVVFSQWGFAPEARYIVQGVSGTSIVIEYVGGKLNVYDNPLGVITNSPELRLADDQSAKLYKLLHESYAAGATRDGEIATDRSGFRYARLGDFTPA
jgi:penicillin V acylase-like amidase (Ntn superfamily)